MVFLRAPDSKEIAGFGQARGLAGRYLK